MQGDRFHCLSAMLSLRDLLRRSRLVLWTGLALAVGIHSGLTLLRGLREERAAAKPLTTQFVKRQPRLSKPLELRKRPVPKRRRIQRRMVSVRAVAARREAPESKRFDAVIGGLAKPRAGVVRAVRWASQQIDPQVAAAGLMSTKQPQGVVDMSTEMLDVEAMDTGKYYAMAIQRGGDKRAIRGFVHLGLVYCTQEERLTLLYEGARPAALLRRIVTAMKEFTNIRADMAGSFSMDNRQLLRVPWVFLEVEGVSFQITDSEAMGLGAYFLEGGVLFAETGWAHCWDDKGGPHWGEVKSIREMFKRALGTYGYEQDNDWGFEVLPPHHPMYHCYFDFDRAPATYRGNDEGRRAASVGEPIHCVLVGDRVVGVVETGDWERFMTPRDVDARRHLQFIANTIIFALTQEGSITKRVMESVNY